MVGDGFGGFGHRFQKVVLRGEVAPHFGRIFRLACRVYPRLACGRGDADRDVLDGTPEAAHGMALEMRKDHREIVVQVVLADEILPEVFATPDRQRCFAFGVHDVDRGDGRKAVVGGGFQVVGGTCAASAVGGVALHDRAVDLFHQVTDQRRLEEIVAARLSGREFDGHFAFGFAAEGLVDFDQVLRIDLPDEIDLRRGFRRAVRAVCLSAGRGRQQDGACHDCHSHFFHCV